ncbi:hypothetical protein GHK68_09345 [Sinorhizobium meliloti]|uniref:ATP-binding protein n=1 Tax=Rhizobium meliloti TaxID=382 RepID=UPI001294C5A9|nr:ATP-binding protein [Sinorhizobium meliloti]MQW42536.1 hypothetical protein [Sinorhizobium meliloti]
MVGNVLPTGIRFETGDGLDDVEVALETGGALYIQCKTTMSLEKDDDSDFAKSVRQIVSNFVKYKHEPKHSSINPEQSALVFAVSLKGPRLVALENACKRVGAGGETELKRASEGEQSAFAIFKSHLENGWTKAGQEPDELDLQLISSMLRVVHFQSGESGSTRQDSSDLLGRALFGAETKGPGALNGLIDVVRTQIKQGVPAKRDVLLTSLRKAGVEDERSPGFDLDIDNLRQLTIDELKRLDHHRFLAIDGNVAITRDHNNALLSAVRESSLLLVGEPGTGKTGTLLQLADDWKTHGPVIFFSADNITAPATLAALREELRLNHAIADILENWPGSLTGLLIVDALDSARNPNLHTVLLKLIEEVARRLPERWRIVVSVRTHELRNGERLKAIFGVQPANAEHVLAELGETRHFAVNALTPDELAAISARSDKLQNLVNLSTPELRALFSNLFNLSLAADLLTSGVHAGSFSSISTQSDLIDRYEDRRLSESDAEHAVAAVIAALVARKVLRTRRFQLAAASVDTLLTRGLLTEDRGYVGFRHHIIFDHATARYFLDWRNEETLLCQLGEDAAGGLILAPAMRFVLERMWKDDRTATSRIWKLLARVLSHDNTSPVIVASILRWIIETVRDRVAASGLLTLVSSPGTPGPRMGLLLLQLARFLELSGKTIPLDSEVAIAWSMIADRAIRTGRKDYIEGARFMLHALQQCKGLQSPEALSAFGLAARALLARCLAEPEYRHARAHAITFVGASFSSDAPASRNALTPLLASSYLDQHGHKEAPTLARHIKEIWRADPDFAVEIYRSIYSQSLPEPVQSVMGGGRIMPMLTDNRQAFTGALYSLGKAIGSFLAELPRHGTKAVNEAAQGEATKAGFLTDKKITIGTPSHTVEIIFAQSDILDWHSRSHVSDDEKPLWAFQQFLASERSDEELQAVIETMLEYPTLAGLWRRLLGTLARHPRPLRSQSALWAVATDPIVLQSRGLHRDAIKYVKATIGLQSEDARAAFEGMLASHVANNETDWDEARSDLLIELGENDVVDLELRQKRTEYLKRRADAVRASQEDGERWMAERAGRMAVSSSDLDAPQNRALTDRLDRLKTIYDRMRADTDSTDGAALCRAIESVIQAESIPDMAEVVLRRLCSEIAEPISGLCEASIIDASDLTLDRILPIVRRLTSSEYPLPTEDTNGHYGVTAHRVYGAEVAAKVWAHFGERASNLEEDFSRLAIDPSPSVRFAVAKALQVVRNVDLQASWRIAETLLAEESFPTIAAIASSSMLVEHDPDLERAEAFLIRSSNLKGPTLGLVSADQVIGTLVCDLAVNVGRPVSAVEISRWLTDLVENEGKLWQVQADLRARIFWPYQHKELAWAEAAGCRAQETFRRIASAAATQFVATTNALVALPPGEKAGDELIQQYQTADKLLDHATNQIYFGSGAYQASVNNARPSDPGLPDDDAKRQFLMDWASTLDEIEEVSNPAAISHLVETYEFLLPADPAYVFDRVAALMLGRGKALGYQVEDLGVDGIVSLVQTCLADHRDIFDALDRRQRLVDILHMFAEHGWHAAVELLFGLPSMLR